MEPLREEMERKQSMEESGRQLSRARDRHGSLDDLNTRLAIRRSYVRVRVTYAMTCVYAVGALGLIAWLLYKDKTELALARISHQLPVADANSLAVAGRTPERPPQSLAEFAADLHEVVLREGRRPVYEEPEKFFALTYPTHALRELVREVALRLAGESAKAVRQLELTYGGGKTHTLITLYLLFHDGPTLPDLPAVREFREHVGADLPRARIAPLGFDKIIERAGRPPGAQRKTTRSPATTRVPALPIAVSNEAAASGAPLSSRKGS